MYTEQGCVFECVLRHAVRILSNVTFISSTIMTFYLHHTAKKLHAMGLSSTL